MKSVKEVLEGIIYPPTEQNVIDAGLLHDVVIKDQLVVVSLYFNKKRDPFALKIRQQIETALIEAFPDKQISCYIHKEPRKRDVKTITLPEKPSATNQIKRIIAVTSGKGGVGKSTVTMNMAITLQQMGYSVGILDADVYGPTQQSLLEGAYRLTPGVKVVDDREWVEPIEPFGVKMMSMSMFVKYGTPILWRGTMAHSALRQFLHETFWGPLDFLLIDMPPGTGDIHLSITSEVKLSGAVIVTTPQEVALSAVTRGYNMLRHEELQVPVLGLIENMSWFTPEEHPDERYYIFGKGGGKAYADKYCIPFLGQIPIIQSIMQGCEEGFPAVFSSKEVKQYYLDICEKLVEKVGKEGLYPVKNY